MSTSALASARRRRATNETQVAPTRVGSTPQQDTVRDQSQPQSQTQTQTLTPLQILQIHDMKIKELETIIADFTDEDLLSKFIDDKLDSNNQLEEIKKSLTSKAVGINTSNDDTLINEKLQLLEQSINSKIEIQNNKIEVFVKSMQEIFANFKEDNSKLIAHITSSIDNQATLKYDSLSNKLINSLEGSNKFL
jgi:hypothetical protein